MNDLCLIQINFLHFFFQLSLLFNMRRNNFLNDFNPLFHLLQNGFHFRRIDIFYSVDFVHKLDFVVVVVIQNLFALLGYLEEGLGDVYANFLVNDCSGFLLCIDVLVYC